MKEEKIKEEVKEVDLDKISFNPFQPRRHFEREELQELASSIQAIGLIHPPVVRPLPGGAQYELISGERRLRAVLIAGLSKIPVIIRASSACLSAQAALIENVQRVDLNAIEIARAMRKLIIEFGFSQELLANRVGKDRSTVANYLRLLSLPEGIQHSVERNLLTMGHAKAILYLSDEKLQNALHDKVLKEGLSVRKTEEIAKRLNEPPSKEEVKKDIHTCQIEEKIQEKLGTKVSVQGKGKKGKIVIDYYSLDDLDRILEILT